MSRRLTFYEFFAGGGMVHAGLGNGWECLVANDFNPMKCATYAENWGSEKLIPGDIGRISERNLPGEADLAWASFPCQDLSLAGGYKGLGRLADDAKTRSGTFWLFHEKMRALKSLGRRPRAIVLENVYGTLTSHGGVDFASIISSVAELGYRLGAMVIDAVLFVPQSRPRLFGVALRDDVFVPTHLISSEPISVWHPPKLTEAYERIDQKVRDRWIWWQLRIPGTRTRNFVDIIEKNPDGVRWDAPEKTTYIMGLMSTLNRSKVAKAKKSGKLMVGAVYRRTRPDEKGDKRQRAEVRFDDVAGCLRTPAGGSSRQSIIIVDGAQVRTRLLSPREAARSMGLSDTYKLPARYNDAYHVCGDGVVVPVVAHLAKNLLEPILVPGFEHVADAAE